MIPNQDGNIDKFLIFRDIVDDQGEIDIQDIEHFVGNFVVLDDRAHDTRGH